MVQAGFDFDFSVHGGGDISQSPSSHEPVIDFSEPGAAGNFFCHGEILDSRPQHLARERSIGILYTERNIL